MFSVIRVAPSVGAVEENRNNEGKSCIGFDQPEELLRTLSPLLSSLKIFGIYFENEFEVRMETITEKVKRYAHRIYTIIVYTIIELHDNSFVNSVDECHTDFGRDQPK